MRTSLPRALCSSGTASGAGYAHHVAERGEDSVGLVGDGEAVVDAAHGKHAHGAAGAVDQLDVFGEDVFEAEAIDGVGVAAADFHDAVVARGIGETANFFRGPGDEFGIAEFIYIAHG